MKSFVIAMVFFLAWALASAQTCSASFTPDTVRPTFFESLKSLFLSFNPKGEAQRLSDFRDIVLDLKQKKSDLKETLSIVLEQNSVPQNSLPSWVKARTDQIPAIENQIVVTFRKMHTEYEQGGLFAGDSSYTEAKDLIDGKVRELRQLCVLTTARLPMTPEEQVALRHAITELEKEIKTLQDIDGELTKLIEKASEQAHGDKKA